MVDDSVKMTAGGVVFGSGVTVLFGAPVDAISAFALWPVVGITSAVAGAGLFVWGLVPAVRERRLNTGRGSVADARLAVARAEGDIAVLLHRLNASADMSSRRRLEDEIALADANLGVLRVALQIAEERGQSHPR